MEMEKKIEAAARFLADPRVHHATVDQRIQFLRDQGGLSEAELWQAVQRVGKSGDTAIASWGSATTAAMAAAGLGCATTAAAAAAAAGLWGGIGSGDAWEKTLTKYCPLHPHHALHRHCPHRPHLTPIRCLMSIVVIKINYVRPFDGEQSGSSGATGFGE